MAEERERPRCGYVAVVGRPNVGKSTLINAILGEKVTIISPRAQTTRHRILGVKTTPLGQAIYVDTPGLHLGGKRAMNRYLNRAASAAVRDVDLVIVVVEALRWTDEDDYVLDVVREADVPALLAVNKVDRVKDKGALLPFLDSTATKYHFEAILPVSAKTGINLVELEHEVLERLPESPYLFPEGQITDRDARFRAAEIIREKLTLRLGQEVPHALTVEIGTLAEREDRVMHIDAVIWVEREGQKRIVIGKGGQVLKEVGTRARREMEAVLGRKIFLQLWVKVKEGWSDDERALRGFGYNE
ncbi:MAG: GTPase Era [Gammaproteobacteria bacterium]|nr:GTPase Era [Gammaproteobacteria bacterium]